MRRFDDWPKRLQAELDHAAGVPFEWGTNDCITFAARVVKAITGTDLMLPHQGAYSTAQGAWLVLKRLGYRDVEAAVGATLGAPLDSVFLAQRGDVVVFDDADGRLGVGICVGEDIAVLALQGLAFLPVVRAKRAWRV